MAEIFIDVGNYEKIRNFTNRLIKNVDEKQAYTRSFNQMTNF